MLERTGVTTFCAPPDGVADADPGRPVGGADVGPRGACRPGEPLNPEVIEQVRAAWGMTIRDGYGQTETTAQVGNPPGAAAPAGLDGPCRCPATR